MNKTQFSQKFQCNLSKQDCGDRCLSIPKTRKFLSLINDENRLRIICVLSHIPKYHVTEIVEAVNLPQNLVSFHLKKMLDFGILSRVKKGTYSYYFLNQEGIDLCLKPLKKLLNQT